MTTIARSITGGVDTHLDVHVAAALDERGALLGVESFSTTASGYRDLLAWLEAFGTLELVGVEGTGSYGAGLTRHLHRQGVSVVEVDRPNRQGDGALASLTPSTPSQRRGPPRVAMPTDRPRPGTETSRPCGCCGSHAARLGVAGLGPSTRCAASSRPPPRNCAQSYGTSRSTKSSGWPVPFAIRPRPM